MTSREVRLYSIDPNDDAFANCRTPDVSRPNALPEALVAAFPEALAISAAVCEKFEFHRYGPIKQEDISAVTVLYLEYQQIYGSEISTEKAREVMKALGYTAKDEIEYYIYTQDELVR